LALIVIHGAAGARHKPQAGQKGLDYRAERVRNVKRYEMPAWEHLQTRVWDDGCRPFGE
jgi:hypothetical protein